MKKIIAILLFILANSCQAKTQRETAPLCKEPPIKFERKPASPIITVKAGTGLQGTFYYSIDTASKTCLMTWVYCHGCGSSAPVPCCNLKRVPEVDKIIRWKIPGCNNGTPATE
ncbi:MAG: hypothetical protein JXR95_13390 [Deltaproteobacteria bacterium]|nr:hypothetical protein [Deltaproteobacteria bacterium]